MIDDNLDYQTPKGTPILLHKNRIFSVIFNGFYHYLEFHGYTRGVIMVPQFSNGDLLLVQVPRAPFFGLSWEFPRGGVTVDETLEGGALREMVEETGYPLTKAALTHLGQIGGDTATLNGASDVFLCRIPDEVVVGAFDTEEIAQVQRVTASDYVRRMANGEIRDGMSMAAYMLAIARGLVTMPL